jgi:hypothetical protein
MIALAFSTLLTIPLAKILSSKSKKEETNLTNVIENDIKLKEQLKVALKDKSYLYLNLGFFTCGFHADHLLFYAISCLRQVLISSSALLICLK